MQTDGMSWSYFTFPGVFVIYFLANWQDKADFHFTFLSFSYNQVLYLSQQVCLKIKTNYVVGKMFLVLDSSISC